MAYVSRYTEAGSDLIVGKGWQGLSQKVSAWHVTSEGKSSVVPFQNREKVRLLRPPLDIAMGCEK